jgi:hypothetical protein
MYLTYNDWLMILGMISFAGFCSYLSHEVEGAISSWLNDL